MLWRCVCCALLAALLTAVLAQPAAAQLLGLQSANFKVIRAETNVRFAADASSVTESLLEREALSDQGAQIVGKMLRTYHKGMQQHEVIEAYTQKADGRKLPVGPDAIQIQSGIAASGTGASLPEMEVVMLTYPDVQPGDRTVLRARLTTRTPMLPGWAQAFELISPSVAFDRVVMHIEAPTSLGMHVFSEGFQAQSGQGDGTQTWDLQTSTVAHGVEPSPANTLTHLPRFYASAWKDHAQLAQAYAVQANAKAVVTDEVRQLAQEITRGKTAPREKAAAIHDWVRRNIRYVAVYLGAGGFVPHDIAWILQNRYGDCKDKALLMQTLLKAVGIEAVPVLIHSLAEFSLPELPTAASFNHCILYLPAFDLYADPTDNRIPFGSLPIADTDKPVAVALAGGAKIMRTRALAPAAVQFAVHSKWRIAKDGKATGRIRVEGDGYAGTLLQDRLAQIPPGMNPQAMQQIMQTSGMRGTGVLRYPAVQRDTQRQSLELDIETPSLLADAQAGSFNPNPRVNLPVYIVNQMGNYSVERREQPMVCPPAHVREEFEVTFDPAFRLTRVPGDFKVKEPAIDFEAHYQLDGQVLSGWRELTLTRASYVCSAAEYAARKPVMERIARHLRSALLYQQP
jgi:hypothetical protein